MIRIVRNRSGKAQQGFTLIEIIVVLIIVGVLSMLSVTYIFKNIKKSHGAEAVTHMASYKSTIEPCLAVHQGSEDACAAITFVETPFFTYAFTDAPDAADPGNWTITATMKGSPGDTISLVRTP